MKIAALKLANIQQGKVKIKLVDRKTGSVWSFVTVTE
jgi:hypothetical protein